MWCFAPHIFILGKEKFRLRSHNYLSKTLLKIKLPIDGEGLEPSTLGVSGDNPKSATFAGK
ncbi:MAG: hypothetical protein ACK5A9_13660 [Pseudanabaena sp.]